MGAILDFRGARGRKAEGGRRSTAADRPAEIVIFPGVRIERWAEEFLADAPMEDDDISDRPTGGRS